MKIDKIYLDSKYERNCVEQFLQLHDLNFEELDYCLGVYDEREQLVAMGGLSKNVLKCFACEKAYRATGIFEQIISKLIAETHRRGYTRAFVFTKTETADYFLVAGFTKIAEGKRAVLMYRGQESAETLLKEKFSVVCGERVARLGAVVMNVNPFTQGHRFLIDEALKQVDRLVVFVVEAEGEWISFAERLHLVRENLKDLDKAIVVGAGDFVISDATFPSYFLKDKQLIDEEHALIDARIFKDYFVRLFKIGWRFVGDEPLDVSTRLYNQVLAEVLPPECKVVVIPRLRIDDKVISASAVRRAVKEGRLEEIVDFVSPYTYKFLADKVKRQSN